MEPLLALHHRYPPEPAHPPGGLVSCIHCFQILGRETAVTPREALMASHTCPESILAKLPAAPPPYN